MVSIWALVFAVAAGFCFVRGLLSMQQRKYRLSVVAFILAILMIAVGSGIAHNSFEANERIVQAQHAGHEALHAQIKADLETAEPGDILETSGSRMFVMYRRSPGSIDVRYIYYYAQNSVFYVDQLVLDHARVLKLGTPEYSAALTAEAESQFRNRRKQK
jgi:hypothetical protein